MNMRYISLLLVGAFLSVSSTRAASIVRKSAVPEDQVPVKTVKIIELPDSLGKYFFVRQIPTDKKNVFQKDTVSYLYEKYISVLDSLNNPETPERYIQTDPDYYRLFLPATYYKSSIGQLSTVNTDVLLADKSPEMDPDLLPLDQNCFNKKERVNKVVDKTLMNLYLNSPEAIVFTEDQLDEAGVFVDNIAKEESTTATKAQRDIINVLTANSPLDLEQEAEVEVRKPEFWKFTGSSSLQFSQHYLSDNWYKGGVSSVSMIGTLQLSANYNDREKVQWENLLDAKLGLASTPSDQVHKYLTNTDQLRIFSKLGVQAAKNWYYTLSAEFKTQFVNGYKSNDPKLISTFLAPADVTVALGMDYKKKSEKFTFSLLLAPLNWTMRYIGSSEVDETTYGLDEGKSVKHNFGSEIKPTLTWNITKNISLESRLDYLTSYKWVRVEWENTLNLAVNRFLSTKFYVHARYDDSAVPLNGSTSYFQLSELLSFGLSYNW
ncbi:MAG: DUF3078 domain-containing protein [Bacteroidaceae bacterium]|nr:DUF3078 domain-containing protein [Bacteroidaceae bacterium]